MLLLLISSDVCNIHSETDVFSNLMRPGRYISDHLLLFSQHGLVSENDMLTTLDNRAKTRVKILESTSLDIEKLLRNTRLKRVASVATFGAFTGVNNSRIFYVISGRFQSISSAY